MECQSLEFGLYFYSLLGLISVLSRVVKDILSENTSVPFPLGIYIWSILSESMDDNLTLSKTL